MLSAPPRPSQSAAFSLVEVTLALGIVSISLLSLIGLLPTGLTALRESMEQTVHAQIVQRIATDLGGAEFASIRNGEVLSFDAEGLPLDGTGAEPARYQAILSELAPSLPGLTNAADLTRLQDHLKRIRIGISRPGTPNAPVVWYAIQVAAR